ncbi:MAG: nucleotidyltransferase family protein [Haliscomenobacter sp.]
MKAMVFAAGLGTRLRPFTDTRPKALVPVQDTPLLEIAIRRLILFGCRDIIINIHHFGEQIVAFLQSKNNFGVRIEISDERNLLLDTGGALKKAAWFLDDAPFILLNADVLSDIDLGALYRNHLTTGAMATLAVRHRPSSRMLLFDETGQLCGWRNSQTGEEKWARTTHSSSQAWSFSGIQVINPSFFSFFPADRDVFSIIDTYLQAAASEKILAYPHDSDIWLDVGRPEQIEKAAAVLHQVLPPL